MRTLAEDLEEVTTNRGRSFVRRARRAHGIAPGEAAAWYVEVRQERPHFDRHMVSIGRSPGDAILTAALEARARNAARRLGVGRWLLEVYGEEGVDPLYLVVRPAYDQQETEAD